MSELERTRALLERALGIRFELHTADAYREQSGGPLAGDWLGAFAQPGVILHRVTVFSAQLDERAGQCIDEYGAARLELHHAGDRLELHKQYAGDPHHPEFAPAFVYTGRIAEGTCAGYWTSRERPVFGGVFWMARADRLEPATADALRARVRATSPRRTVLLGLVAAMWLAVGFGWMVSPLIAAAGFATWTGLVWLMHRRTRALRGDVERWQRELGSGDRMPPP